MLVMRHDTPYNPTQQVLTTSWSQQRISLDGPSRDRHPIVEKHEYSTAIRPLDFILAILDTNKFGQDFSEGFLLGTPVAHHIFTCGAAPAFWPEVPIEDRIGIRH